jgi:activator of 2-hydroxyglutaryl-CoA dehydratase
MKRLFCLAGLNSAQGAMYFTETGESNQGGLERGIGMLVAGVDIGAATAKAVILGDGGS